MFVYILRLSKQQPDPVPWMTVVGRVMLYMSSKERLHPLRWEIVLCRLCFIHFWKCLYIIRLIIETHWVLNQRKCVQMNSAIRSQFSFSKGKYIKSNKQKKHHCLSKNKRFLNAEPLVDKGYCSAQRFTYSCNGENMVH